MKTHHSAHIFDDVFLEGLPTFNDVVSTSWGQAFLFVDVLEWLMNNSFLTLSILVHKTNLVHVWASFLLRHPKFPITTFSNLY
jgi:hypothetical protein